MVIAGLGAPELASCALVYSNTTGMGGVTTIFSDIVAWPATHRLPSVSKCNRWKWNSTPVGGTISTLGVGLPPVRLAAGYISSLLLASSPEGPETTKLLAAHRLPLLSNWMSSGRLRVSPVGSCMIRAGFTLKLLLTMLLASILTIFPSSAARGLLAIQRSLLASRAKPLGL